MANPQGTLDLNVRLANIDKAVRELQRRLGNINANIKIDVPRDAVRNFGAFVQAINASGPAIQKASAEVDRLAKSFQNLKSQLPNSGAAGGGIVNITRAINSQNRALQQQASEQKKLISLSSDLGRQTAITIRRFGGFIIVRDIFAGIGGAFREATRQAVDFERELARIAQLQNTSIAQTRVLGDFISSLATQYGTAAEDFVKAAQVLAQAGRGTGDIQTILRGLAPASLTATFGDLEKSTGSLNALLGQFKLEAGQTTQVLDSLAAVAENFNVSIDELFEGIRRSGSVFAALDNVQGPQQGLKSLREFAALFTSVIDTSRESADVIGTSFRTILPRIQRRRTREILGDLGIDLLTDEGQFVGTFEAIKRISQALGELSSNDPAFSAIVEELGGLRQIARAIPLVQQIGKATRALEIAQNSQGEVARDAAIAQQTLQNQLAVTAQRFKELLREITQTETFKILANTFLEITNRTIDLADSLQDLIPLIATIGGARLAVSAGQFLSGAASASVIGRRTLRRNSGGKVSTLLTPGELVFNPDAVRREGESALQNFNRTGDISLIKSLAGAALVPGVGNTDSVQKDLPPGSFVVKKSSVNKGLGFQRFAYGGKVRKKMNSGGILRGGLNRGTPGETLGVRIDAALLDARQEKLIRDFTRGAQAFGVDANSVVSNVRKLLAEGLSEQEVRRRGTQIFGQSGVGPGFVLSGPASVGVPIIPTITQSIPPQPIQGQVIQPKGLITGDEFNLAPVDTTSRQFIQNSNFNQFRERDPVRAREDEFIRREAFIDRDFENEQLRKQIIAEERRRRTAAFNESINVGRGNVLSGAGVSIADDIAGIAREETRSSVKRRNRINTQLRLARESVLGTSGTIRGATANVGRLAGRTLSGIGGVGSIVAGSLISQNAGSATTSALGGGLAGAGLGAQLGSALGPIGSAAGALAGALIGAAGAADQFREEAKAKKIQDAVSNFVSGTKDSEKQLNEAFKEFSNFGGTSELGSSRGLSNLIFGRFLNGDETATRALSRSSVFSQSFAALSNTAGVLSGGLVGNAGAISDLAQRQSSQDVERFRGQFAPASDTILQQFENLAQSSGATSFSSILNQAIPEQLALLATSNRNFSESDLGNEQNLRALGTLVLRDVVDPILEANRNSKDLAQTLAQLSVSTVTFNEVMDRIGANFRALANQAEAFDQVTSSIVGIGNLQGQVSTRAPFNVFDNLAGVPDNVVNAELGRLSSQFGLQDSGGFNIASSAVGLQSRIRNNLPGILTEASVRRDAGTINVSDFLLEKLREENIPSVLSDTLEDVIRTSFPEDRELNLASAGEQVNEVTQKLVSALDPAAEQIQALTEAEKNYIRQLDQIANQRSQLELSTLQRSVDVQRLRSTFTDTRRQILGLPAAGVTERENQLSREVGILTGFNTVDPTVLGGRLREIGAGGVNAGNVTEFNALVEALRLLSSDTRTLDATMEKANQLEQASQGSRNLFERILGGGPDEILRINQEVADLQTIAGGGSVGGQRGLAAIRTGQQLLDSFTTEQLQGRFGVSREQLQSNLDGILAAQGAGFFAPGRDRSIGRQLAGNIRGDGRQALVDQASDAIGRQATAIRELNSLTVQQIEQLNSTTQQYQEQFLQGIREAFSEEGPITQLSNSLNNFAQAFGGEGVSIEVGGKTEVVVSFNGLNGVMQGIQDDLRDFVSNITNEQINRALQQGLPNEVNQA